MEYRERPVGVSILAGLHVAGGVLGVIFTVFMALKVYKNPEYLENISMLGIPPLLIFFAVLFICVLAFLSGVGMWIGRKWGWFLGSFYYIYSVFISTNALVTINIMTNSLSPEELAEMSRSPSYYYTKHIMKIIIHSLLYLYFFKTNVIAFFDMLEYKKWKSVVIQLGICIVIAVIVNLVIRM